MQDADGIDTLQVQAAQIPLDHQVASEVRKLVS